MSDPAINAPSHGDLERGKTLAHLEAVFDRAMPQVWRFRPDVNLLIAGGRTLFAESVERTVAEWPDAYRRRCALHLGFPEERKPWLFGAIDMLASPSGFESFGMAYLEAWAAGKPVIGARSGAVQGVIADGVDGLLIDYQDDRALALAILDLLRDPAAASAMGAAGRAKVDTRYTWRRIADQFRTVYSGLATRS